jgi:hypothetical protein
MSGHGWIGVDLDGTLAHYDGWKGVTHVGEPIAPVVERVKRWIAEGRAVKVFTARIAEPDHLQRGLALVAIDAWCQRHLGVTLPVTNVKDFGMIELWDDRAVQVVANTGEPVGTSTRGLT